MIVFWFFLISFVRYIRWAAEATKTFITAQVWAEMKKTVAYKVDLSFDVNGVVDEAQCECGAGQGPGAHCKHVQVILFSLLKLNKDGSTLTELTCTQVNNMYTIADHGLF